MIAIVPQMRVQWPLSRSTFARDRWAGGGLPSAAQADPTSGACSFFGSRQRRSIKILAYDGQGLCVVREAAFARAV